MEGVCRGYEGFGELWDTVLTQRLGLFWRERGAAGRQKRLETAFFILKKRPAGTASRSALRRAGFAAVSANDRTGHRLEAKRLKARDYHSTATRLWEISGVWPHT